MPDMDLYVNAHVGVKVRPCEDAIVNGPMQLQWYSGL